MLGLANQFRERISGYALLVNSLTALTRHGGTGKDKPDNKVVPTPEAIIEFENLKALLNSPIVLKQFRYDRPTIVYMDASVGSRPGDLVGEVELPGGLGAVIVQTDDDGRDYVCAYASAGLTPAQKNYHIVRLELLAFVFACGKFYDWLAGIPFTWRSDCRAHEFLHTAKTSTNPTIARYALTLAEFNFHVEWIPGLTMIADSFSRMVVFPCNDITSPAMEAVSLPEVVFGFNLGKRIHAMKHGGPLTTGTSLVSYVPTCELVVESPVVMEFEDEIDGWTVVDIMGRAEVPVTTSYPCSATDLVIGLLIDVPLYSCEETTEPPMLEELSVWPKMTLRESQMLRALPYLRRWIVESCGGVSDESVEGAISHELVKVLGEIRRKV